MKPLRILILALSFLVLLLGLIVALAFNPGAQTWAARRFAPASPALTVTFDSVDAGLQRTRVNNLKVVQPGLVFTLPSAEVDVNLLDAAREKIAVKRLVAHGWILDLTTPGTAKAPLAIATPPTTNASNVPASTLAPRAASAEQQARAAFNGLFARLKLHFDLAIDGIDLEGDVILPEGRIHVAITGGGLKAGHEGKWAIIATVVGTDATPMTVQGELVARLMTPRSFDRIELALNVAATRSPSPQPSAGASLSVNLRAASESQRETYAAILTSGPRELLNVNLVMPTGSEPLTGSWKLDVTTADAAPFALGHALPDFAGSGHGDFSTDRTFTQMRTSGSLDAWGDKLALLRPEFGSLGRLDLRAAFELSAIDQLVHLKRCDLRLSAGTKPVVSITALQPIAFNRTTGALAATPDATPELMSLVIDGIALAWAQPFLGELELTGQDLRGAFTVLASNGGLSLRNSQPLTLANLNVAQRGRLLVNGVDVALAAQADYSPQGWNTEITRLTVSRAQAPILKLSAKAGQPAGEQQPLTASGTYELELPEMLAQPLASGSLALSKGVARGDFSASFGAAKTASLTLQLTNLVAANAGATRLPSVVVLARADVDAAGRLNAQMPIVISQGARRSEITLKAARNSTAGATPLSAQVTAGTVYLEDLLSFAALLAPAPADSFASAKPTSPLSSQPPLNPAKQSQSAAAISASPIAPIWAGAYGDFKLDIKSLVYSRELKINEINAGVQLTPGALKLDGLRATLSTGGQFQAAGALRFDAKQAEPYELKADVSLDDLESAPLLRALSPGRPSPLEGKFKLTTQLAGRAPTPSGFGGTAIGDIALNSTGGTLRILSVKTGAQADTVATVAAVAGLFGAFTGSDATVKKAEQVRAAAVVAKQLSAIAYTQLNVVVGRDDQRNLAVKDLTLLSPQIRLAGSGQITQKAGVPLFQQPLLLSLKLSSREPLTSSLRSLKLVAETADAQGYSFLLDEVILDGSLQSIGTGQLQRLLDRAQAE
ncbi:MAG: hypothetical protein H2172_03010 [Opitutus sp.]|nr:hypothetical protein [Opitutus sp.]MCS6246082.1 hypothetical protein [Opitutus sp.]MCS6274127.1 hypothetical protein [Opitutus sp.]MCS6277791.1 hypothetical protein [Opitutus sp.]MCS6299103.1 hypothetical protein [Opitutus sp.]